MLHNQQRMAPYGYAVLAFIHLSLIQKLMNVIAIGYRSRVMGHADHGSMGHIGHGVGYGPRKMTHCHLCLSLQLI